MTEPLYSTSAVAAILEISPARVRVLAQDRGVGRKPAGGPNAPWLFTASDIEAMRERRPGRPPLTASPSSSTTADTHAAPRTP